MFKKRKLCRIAITEYPSGYAFKTNGETNQLLTAMLVGIAKIIKETGADSIDNAMAMINLNKALRSLLQEEGVEVPYLLDMALMDEAKFHFENVGDGISDKEALRIAEAVTENDSIWDEMYALMQDIHEEI